MSVCARGSTSSDAHSTHVYGHETSIRTWVLINQISCLHKWGRGCYVGLVDHVCACGSGYKSKCGQRGPRGSLRRGDKHACSLTACVIKSLTLYNLCVCSGFWWHNTQDSAFEESMGKGSVTIVLSLYARIELVGFSRGIFRFCNQNCLNVIIYL